MDATSLASHVPSDAGKGRYVLKINLLKWFKQPPFIF